MGENELCKVADPGQMVQLPKDGDSCVIKLSEITKSQIRWCAPEYLKERKCSTASDVWSFGILAWEMAHPGKQPYSNFSDDEVAGKIMAGYSLTIPTDYPKPVQDIVKSCWKLEPTKRPCFNLICFNLSLVRR